ncbi:MAG: PDR/VanB family oxidoreductase [Hyphomicrobiaceae bacterium]
MTDDRKLLQLTIMERLDLTPSITQFVLARADGGRLPEFEPGAHVTVETPSGAMRRYSLLNDGSAPDRYVIAVKREPDSRGGSESMHADALPSATLRVEAPQNDFRLVPAPRYLLIAGGIGITPILAMARALDARQDSFRLIYCTRSAEETAYLDKIVTQFGDRAVIHHDNGDPAKVYDFWDDLEAPDNSHVYCCGPAALMEDVRGMSGHWPEGRVHFEDFKPIEVVRSDDRAFSVTINATGQSIMVPADRSILEALRDAGVKTSSSCESGTCGTCKATLIRGSVEHRDMVLEESEKAAHIMLCVSRASDGDLVIDL